MQLSDKQIRMLKVLPYRPGVFAKNYQQFCNMTLRAHGRSQRAGIANTYRSLMALGLVDGGPNDFSPVALTDQGRLLVDEFRRQELLARKSMEAGK